LPERQAEAPLVFGFYAVINGFWLGRRLLFEHRSQRRSRVFRININASSENALVCDVCSSEIKTALDRKMSLVLDLLCNQFA